MWSLAQRVLDTPTSATVLLADDASKMRRQGVDVLDFSAGRAAEATPEPISREASRALLDGDTHQTMAQGTPEFREACAKKLARENGLVVDPDTSLIATLGCKHGLLLAMLTTIDPGDEVIVEDPCFVSYQPTIQFCGGRPVAVPLRRERAFRWTQADLEAAITDRTKAILYCSPHNPAGIVHTTADLDVITAVACRHDLLVIADETYERLTWGGRTHVSVASLPGMRERTITLMGLTKSFSMGGWRIGFLLAPPRLLTAMVAVQQHLTTCAGSFTQAGAAVALRDAPSPEVEVLWRDWEDRCRFVAAELDALPRVACAAPEGGFYAWIDVSALGIPSAHLAERLLQQHRVVLVPGSAFGPSGEGFLRMTCVKSWAELEQGLPRVKAGLS